MAKVQLSIEDLGDVYEEIFEARPKWYFIGLRLKQPVNILDGIESQYGSDLVKCFCEMLKKWLTRVDPPPTWKAMSEALSSQSVDKAQLALKVTRNHSHPENPVQDAARFSESLRESEAVVGKKAEVWSLRLRSHTGSLGTSPLERGSGRLARVRGSSSSSGIFSDELQEKAFGCGCGKCTINSFIDKGCPTPTTTASFFPYLSTEGLTTTEQEILRGKLLLEFQKITMHFSHLMSETCKSLIQRCVTVQELVRVLIYLGAFQPSVGHKPILDEKLEELRKAESIDDVFYILRHYISFFNYDIIEHIINELGSAEDHSRLQTYKAELDEYSKRSVFECPSYSVSQPDHAVLIMKIEGIYEYNVKQLEAFKACVSSIIRVSKYTLRLCSVEKGCLELRFQIPYFVKEVIFPLSLVQIEALRGQRVKKLMCGDHVYSFSAKMSHFAEVNPFQPIPSDYDGHFTSCHTVSAPIPIPVDTLFGHSFPPHPKRHTAPQLEHHIERPLTKPLWSQPPEDIFDWQSVRDSGYESRASVQSLSASPQYTREGGENDREELKTTRANHSNPPFRLLPPLPHSRPHSSLPFEQK